MLAISAFCLEHPMQNISFGMESVPSITWYREKKWTRQVVYLISSLTLEQLQAKEMLSLKRGYWVVESRLHHCLDISLREDESRDRTPKAARILGTIREISTQPTAAYLPPEFYKLLAWITKKRSKPEDEWFRIALTKAKQVLVLLGGWCGLQHHAMDATTGLAG